MELLLILLQIITYSTFQCDSVFDMRLLLSLNYYKVFYRQSIEKYLKENFSERVNKINPEDKKNYVRMLFAILYHHYNSDLMRMVSSSKRQLENIFSTGCFSGYSG